MIKKTIERLEKRRADLKRLMPDNFVSEMTDTITKLFALKAAVRYLESGDHEPLDDL